MENVSLHLGPGGPTFKTRDQAVSELQSETAKLYASGLTLDVRVESEARLLRAHSRSRFFVYRDTSHKSEDIAADPQPNRRRRGFSITRDMMRGPGAGFQAQALMAGRDGEFPVLSQPYAGANIDRQRFLQEADKLRMYRIVDEKDLPDWTQDDSILEFFGMVYDKAMEEAKGSLQGGNIFNKVIDAAPGIYLFTELLKRTNRLIEEDFTELWARRVFPVNNLNTWLPQWSYERIDDRGVLPSYVDTERLPSGAPRGGENRKGVIRPLVFYHHAASWSNIELMRYAEAVANGAPNIKLDQRRIDTAIRMMNVKEDLLAFFGEDDTNLFGVFSPQAKTGIVRVPAGGKFGAGTTEQDRQLLTRDVKLTFEDTEKILQPDALLLSTNTWAYVNDKRYGGLDSDSNQTVMEAAMATLEKFGIKDVMCIPEVGYNAKQEGRLKDHGVPAAEAARLAGGLDGKQTMVSLKRDPDAIELIVAKDRTMYPARETVNDRVEARMLAGSGAMAFYKPASLKITTDCGPA